MLLFSLNSMFGFFVTVSTIYSMLDWVSFYYICTLSCTRHRNIFPWGQWKIGGFSSNRIRVFGPYTAPAWIPSVQDCLVRFQKFQWCKLLYTPALSERIIKKSRKLINWPEENVMLLAWVSLFLHSYERRGVHFGLNHWWTLSLLP